MKKQKPHKSSVPVYFAIGGGLLLLVAAILLATQNTPAASVPVTSHEEETYPEISRVSLDDAKTALDGGTAIIVDVRSAEAYQASHIAGAVHIPFAELEIRLGELGKLPPPLAVVVYCRLLPANRKMGRKRLLMAVAIRLCRFRNCRPCWMIKISR